MTNNLKPCPMCGSPANIDSTGTAECYGWAWQTLTVECADTMGHHCGMSISINADHNYLESSSEKVTNLWNSIGKQNEK